MNHRYLIQLSMVELTYPYHIQQNKNTSLLCTFGLSFSSSARKMAEEVSQEENQQESESSHDNGM